MLPKGRRNVNESRKDAAVREVTEETGYACHLLPVKMSTRACASDDPSDVPDEAKVRDDITEPFMCSVRDLGGVKGAKFIWWYVAVVNAEGEKGKGEDEFTAEWFEVHEAVEKLWFETDREVLNMAISIVKDTLG
ncbi:hypothetical protein BKA63DRAFT_506331 [Paraphoma chrysanthemicola]|nr:hypothetical protein BKA63DRAFT_506331 [Paraphoma chrysanthemicola]